jgi:hypothetical protein
MLTNFSEIRQDSVVAGLLVLDGLNVLAAATTDLSFMFSFLGRGGDSLIEIIRTH